MKRSIILFTLLTILTIGTMPVEVPVMDVTIKDIIDYPYDFISRNVRIIGTATPGSLGQASGYYYLTDDVGNKIKVFQALKNYPSQGQPYALFGSVRLSDDKREVVFTEFQRELLSGNGDLSIGIDIIILGIVALALFFYIGYLIYKIAAKKDIPILTPTPGQSPLIPPKPAEDKQPEKIDGKMIRLTPHPDVTCNLLDGRFRTVKGDDIVREIRFFRPLGKNEIEFDFGRKETDVYTQVKLKTAGVASKQASLKNSEDGDDYDGTYTLVNHAKQGTTQTKVNGKPMEEGDELTLNEGDKIEMGVVVFIFTKED